MGDVHPLGNPHYWLDPENGKVIARAIAGKLSQLRPNDKAYFDQRLADFTRRLDEAREALAGGDGAVQGTEGRHLPPVVSRTSPTASGSTSIGYVEPRPGIPPTPQHTLDLINEMKRQNVKLVLVEPYFDLKTPNAIGRADRRAGAGAAAVGRRRQGRAPTTSSCSTTTSTCWSNAIKKTGTK